MNFNRWTAVTIAIISPAAWGLEVQGVTLGTTTIANAAEISQLTRPTYGKGCAEDSCLLDGKVGNFPVRVSLYSPKGAAGVIHSVTIMASDNRYNMFREALEAKYGKPSSEEKKTDTMSQRGTKYERMVAVWTLPDGTIELDERTPIAILGYTQVTYKTTSYAIESERQRNEYKDKVKQGL